MKTRLLSFFLAAAIFSSLTFEAFHAGHEAECHEENCPVCLVIQIIRTVIRLTMPAASLSFVQKIIITAFIINLSLSRLILLTPVMQKIRLNI